MNNNFLKFSNLLLKMITHTAVSFYTTWGLFLFGLYVIGILTPYQSSIFIILLNVFFGGMLITYVYPREIVIPYINRKIRGIILKFYNFLFHVIPLAVFVYMYNPKIKQDNLYLAIFSLLLYVLLFNPLEIYNYKEESPRKIVANILVVFYILMLCILIIKQKNLF